MKVIASCVVSVLAVSSAQAGLVNPLIQPWAGGANSQFAQWDSFTSAFGGLNLPDAPGSAAFSLMNFSPDAIITGSGNIYGSNSPLYVMVMGSSLSGQTPLQVVANIATAGNFIPAGGVRLVLFNNLGNSVTINPATTEVRSESPTPPAGGVGDSERTSVVAGLIVTELPRLLKSTRRTPPAGMKLPAVAMLATTCSGVWPESELPMTIT